MFEHTQVGTPLSQVDQVGSLRKGDPTWLDRSLLKGTTYWALFSHIGATEEPKGFPLVRHWPT